MTKEEGLSLGETAHPLTVQRVVWLLPSGFAATCPEP